MQPPPPPQRPPPPGYGPPPPGYGPPLVDPTLADPGSRLLARLIDLAICLVAIIVIFAVTAAVQYGIADGDALDDPLSITMVALRAVGLIAGPYLYEWLMLARCGATVGKRAMRIRVVRADRGPIGGGRAAGRVAIMLVFGWVPCLGLLDELWLLWDRPLQQCLHDKVVTTVVVRAFPRGGPAPG